MVKPIIAPTIYPELMKNSKLITHIERVDIIFYELNHLKKQAFVTIPFISTS